MRINIHTYAHILYETLENEENLDLVISNFVLLLARNNHLKYKVRIIDRFCELYNKKHNIVALEVVSKSALDEDSLEKIKVLYKKRSGADTIEIVNSIHANMKGGIALKTSGEMMDGSIDRSLVDLKKSLIVNM